MASTITLNLYVYMSDNGDGSASAHFFSTKEKAEARAERELEEFGSALCDNVYPITFVIDSATGEVLEGVDDLEEDDD